MCKIWLLCGYLSAQLNALNNEEAEEMLVFGVHSNTSVTGTGTAAGLDLEMDEHRGIT